MYHHPLGASLSIKCCRWTRGPFICADCIQKITVEVSGYEHLSIRIRTHTTKIHIIYSIYSNPLNKKITLPDYRNCKSRRQNKERDPGGFQQIPNNRMVLMLINGIRRSRMAPLEPFPLPPLSNILFLRRTECHYSEDDIAHCSFYKLKNNMQTGVNRSYR